MDFNLLFSLLFLSKTHFQCTKTTYNEKKTPIRSPNPERKGSLVTHLTDSLFEEEQSFLEHKKSRLFSNKIFHLGKGPKIKKRESMVFDHRGGGVGLVGQNQLLIQI